jgi:bifunctional DNase/RNase
LAKFLKNKVTMENKIKLNVLGLTYTQPQSHAFALILGEPDSNRKLPIIIGAIEAQAIALLANGMNLQRPFTHDLIIDVLKINNMQLREVHIYKADEGIFYSQLLCYRVDDDKIIRIESRTSDAIALAVLTGCPIYTSEEIMEKASIVIDEQMFMNNNSKTSGDEPLSAAVLEAKMQKAIEEENYELAATLRDQLKEMAEK